MFRPRTSKRSFIAPYLLLAFQDISGCNASPVEGADPGDSSLVYICSSLSREDGTFVFPSLASGEYTVVSFVITKELTPVLNLKISLQKLGPAKCE